MSLSFNFRPLTLNLPLRRVIGGLIILAIGLSMFAVPVGINLEKNTVLAQTMEPDGKCYKTNYTPGPGGGIITSKTEVPCSTSASALKDNLESCFKIISGTIAGCFEWITYFLFVTIPSWLMIATAKMFNFMVTVTLSSNMYKADFIEKIWRVVRDFANIFFILILLYAAFQIMLDLGHGGGKKIIASVILIALLVNFSLFFTKIVIDASNIVALIFYNRIDTSEVKQFEKIGDEAKFGVQQKDLAGALVSAFNPNVFFDKETFEKIRADEKENLMAQFDEYCANNPGDPNCAEEKKQAFATYLVKKPSAIIMISIMVAYGLVIYAVAYALFVVALSFLGRLIALIVLMVVSPFAFVSYAVPKFRSIDTIGFDSWLKKLFETAFVAAIFMFILYITSQVLAAKIFGDAASQKGIIETLLMVFIPAILIVMLLLKGAKYAKSASGEFTSAIISTAKVAGGLAIGGAALGLAAAGRATVGATAKYVQSDQARAKALDLKGNLAKIGREDLKGWRKISPYHLISAAAKGVAATGRAAQAGTAELIHKTPIGKKMQDLEKGFGEKTHATHILDAKTQ